MLEIYALNDSTSFPIPLTGNETMYQLVSVTGLEPPKSQINLTKAVNLDGAIYNSTSIDTRQIVIILKLNRDLENIRQAFYSLFNVGKTVELRLSNSQKAYSIEGYVDSIECNLFVMAELMQISIICPNPNFKILENTRSGAVEVSLGAQSDGWSKYTRITTNTSFELSFKMEFSFNTPATFFSFGVYDITNSIYRHEIETGDKIIVNYSIRDFNIVRERNGTKQSIAADFETINFFQLKPSVENLVIYGARNGETRVANLIDATLFYNNEVRGI